MKTCLVSFVCLTGLLAMGTEGESLTNRFPEPPWTRFITASGWGPAEFSARLYCQSDAKPKIRKLEKICESHNGVATSGFPFCSFCQELGAQWRCHYDVRVRCLAAVDDDLDY